MSKGNPIVGLAHVVASQQEMLEEANCRIAELVHQNDKRVNALEEENAKLQHQCEEKDATITEIREELKKTRENLQKDCDYFSGEYDRAKKQLLELEEQLKRERSNPFHWQKWEEGKEFPLDKFGNVPWVDGLYLFNNDSQRTVWIEKEHRCVSLAGKYGIDCVDIPATTKLKDRGVFTISPSQSLLLDGGTLVAVNIRDMTEVTFMDAMPELIDEE